MNGYSESNIYIYMWLVQAVLSSGWYIISMVKWNVVYALHCGTTLSVHKPPISFKYLCQISLKKKDFGFLTNIFNNLINALLNCFIYVWLNSSVYIGATQHYSVMVSIHCKGLEFIQLMFMWVVILKMLIQKFKWYNFVKEILIWKKSF